MINSLFSVKDKVVIITGANQGIGKILALGLLKNGAIVYRIDKKFKKSKKKLVKIRNGNHSLSRKNDLKKICQGLDNLASIYL